MPKYRRYHLPGHPIFLTLVAQNRRPWLAQEQNVELVLQSIHWAKTKYPFRHIAHVILHDHLHWILFPEPETNFSDLVAAIKRDVTWRLKESGRIGPFWQKRFYDHIIRDDDDFARHLDYVHFNPVKHGLVERPIDHRWSSFKEWVKRDAYAEDWGAIEPESVKEMDLE
jgi:putative transposase